MLRKPALCLNDLAQGGGFSASSASKYVAFTPRRRQDGGPHCLGGDLSGFRVDATMPPRQRSRPAAACPSSFNSRNLFFATIAASPGMFHWKPGLGAPPISPPMPPPMTRPRALGISSHATLVARVPRARVLHRSGVPRTAARRRGECAKTARRLHDAAAEITPSNRRRPAISTTPRQPEKP